MTILETIKNLYVGKLLGVWQLTYKFKDKECVEFFIHEQDAINFAKTRNSKHYNYNIIFVHKPILDVRVCSDIDEKMYLQLFVSETKNVNAYNYETLDLK